MARKPTKQKTEAEKAAIAQAKAAKFVELATKRVNKALNAIRQLENLSNRGSYSYTDEQAAKLVSALGAAVVKVRDRFTSTGKKEEGGFSF